MPECRDVRVEIAARDEMSRRLRRLRWRIRWLCARAWLLRLLRQEARR